LLPTTEIIGQIDPGLMRLMLEQYFKPSVKDAPLSAHGDASMGHTQEKYAPGVNQRGQRLPPCPTESTMMVPVRLAFLQSQSY
jgi:hypothetical protein